MTCSLVSDNNPGLRLLSSAIAKNRILLPTSNFSKVQLRVFERISV
ncbi:hypothetical protein [Microcoleus sp. CAWBG556]|nr:hypothetical protein [Microcoleus sp. CAWBG556]